MGSGNSDGIHTKVRTFAFDASAQTITFTDKTLLLLGAVLLIRNVTDNIVIYNAADPNLGGSIAAAGDVLTLTYNTTTMDDADQIAVDIAPVQSVNGSLLRKMMVALQPPVWSAGPSSVNAGAYLDMRPSVSGDEVKIVNFVYAGNVELYIYDGATRLLVDSFTGPASSTNYALPATRTRYYQLKNVEASAKILSADGVYTTKV